jgi:predicted metal-dependent peptidase
MPVGSQIGCTREETMTTVQTRIDRARWWALTNQPFYGALAMRLPDKMDPSCDTAYTNGRVIAWNPSFVESLTDEELRFALLHETLHCAHQHMWRLPADERGNEAGDHEINLTLQAIPGISMPKDIAYCDHRYSGMACEEILGTLPEPEDGDGGGGGDDGDDGDDENGGGSSGPGDGQPGKGKPGKGEPGPGSHFGPPAGGQQDGQGQPDPAAQAQASQQLRDEWEGAVIQAAQAQQAMGAGTVPGDMQRILDRVRHQSIDWRREMADFVKDAMSERNDWSRSSRRHAWQPVIYPRKRTDELGKVIFVRDTSGSVSDRQLAAYSALITECIADTGCTGVVIDCDADIKAEYELDAGTDCPLTAKGGGGTDLRPPFQRADVLSDMGEHIAGLVYITDLDAGNRVPELSEIPTLWLSTTNKVGPFGRTVHIET